MNSSCICSKKARFNTIIDFNKSKLQSYLGISIGKCENCGVLKTFTNKESFNPQSSMSSFYEGNKEKFLKFFYPIVLKLKSIKAEGDVLDVGCSSGILLEILQKEKFNIWGIEPNKKAYAIAKKKFKKKIFQGVLEDFLNLQNKKFDIIIYNHVLEHIKDINKELYFIKKALKKDGVLIIGVPNTSNIIFYLRGLYWENLRPKEHMWHFSKKYLEKYIKGKGFKILYTSFENDERIDYPFVKRIYFKVLIFINQIFNTGEAILIFATKK